MWLVLDKVFAICDGLLSSWPGCTDCMLKMCIVVQCVQVCPDCTDLETVVSVAEKGCFADGEKLENCHHGLISS